MGDHDRRIETVRAGHLHRTARNARGAEVRIGAAAGPGVRPSFTPVELLLAAFGCCGGAVVDRTARPVAHDVPGRCGEGDGEREAWLPARAEDERARHGTSDTPDPRRARSVLGGRTVRQIAEDPRSVREGGAGHRAGGRG
ncbi:hypothetical protein ACWCP6_26640 [Streptomyces sp. NPDC002004]